MSENVTEVIVGGIVVAVAAGFLVYAADVTGTTGGGADGYELNASFRSADGVDVGTDVRLAGVKVGRVTDIALDPQTYRARTTFTVTNEVEIPDDSAIIVASEGLLGGNFVEIQPGGSPFYFEPGDEIEFTQGSVSLISLLAKFVAGNNGGDGQAQE